MRRIADEANSTTGLLTHYFGSREELLIAALRHVHRAAGARMLEAIEQAESDPLRAVIAESLPLDETRMAEWRIWLAFWGQAVASPRLAEEQRARYREWVALLASLTRDTPITVEVLVAVLDGIGTRATLDPDAFGPQQQLAMVDTFLNHNG